MGNDAGGYCEPERLCRMVELTEKRSGLHPSRSNRGVHPDRLHQRQIDDQATVTGGVARKAVRSSAHRDAKVMRPGETDRGPHVRYVGAAQDQRRVSVDRSVPHLSLSVVRPIAGTDELTVQRLAEFVDGALLNPNLSGAG
jgi:hypothetical protein